MRWFWLGAYEVSVGKPLVFEHAADDREAVKRSTAILIGEIERLMERSARRLADASRPLATGMREPSGSATKHIRLPADQDLARLILGAIMSERLSWGWKLVSASKKPGCDVAVLEWDTRREVTPLI